MVREFGNLDQAQLNWRASAGSWSIAQCLDHLRIADEACWPMFDAVAEGRKHVRAIERIPLLPRLFGPLMLWAVSPTTRTPAKTTPALHPSTSDLPATIVEDFAAHVDDHTRKILAMSHVDHAQLIVTSPFASFVTYSLEHAVRVAVAHLERHRLQAVRVMQDLGFPERA